jgi:hypothetical protein
MSRERQRDKVPKDPTSDCVIIRSSDNHGPDTRCAFTSALGTLVALSSVMKQILRTLVVAAIVAACAQSATAQNGHGLLSTFEVQRLASTDTPESHAALARHFVTLVAIYRADADRYEALATLPSGNPNHPTSGAREHYLRQAEASRMAAASVRALVAYHQLASIGFARTRPRAASAFEGGKGAPRPTSAEITQLEMMARTPADHELLAEYFLTVRQTETANAEAYSRRAGMARVSGARDVTAVVSQYGSLAATARTAARLANAAMERHRQLATVG